MHSHEVCQIELTVCRPYKKRTSFFKPGNMFSGKIIISKKPSAVLVTFQRGHLVVIVVLVFVAFVVALTAKATQAVQATGAAKLGEVDSAKVLAYVLC